jgi:hypothetical protein
MCGYLLIEVQLFAQHDTSISIVSLAAWSRLHRSPIGALFNSKGQLFIVAVAIGVSISSSSCDYLHMADQNQEYSVFRDISIEHVAALVNAARMLCGSTTERGMGQKGTS